MSRLTGADCRFEVRDGQAYCLAHEAPHEIGDWEAHEDRTNHEIVALPMRHILYVAFYCATCNDGFVLIDEEQ